MNRAMVTSHTEATAPPYHTHSWVPAAPPAVHYEPGSAQPSIYPALGQALPDTPSQGVNPTQYRLEILSKMRQDLMDEKMDRRRLYKKCKRLYNWLDRSGSGLALTAMTVGTLGLVPAVTVVGLPATLAFEIGAGLIQFLSVALHVAKRVPARGAKKHDALYTLAVAKLDSISGQISQALDDGTISQVECDRIIREIQQYYQSKAEIRGKPREADENADKNDLKKGEEEFALRLRNLTGAGSSPAK